MSLCIFRSDNKIYFFIFSQNYSKESYYMMADERNSPRIDTKVRNINISAF